MSEPAGGERRRGVNPRWAALGLIAMAAVVVAFFGLCAGVDADSEETSLGPALFLTALVLIAALAILFRRWER